MCVCVCGQNTEIFGRENNRYIKLPLQLLGSDMLRLLPLIYFQNCNQVTFRHIALLLLKMIYSALTLNLLAPTAVGARINP